MATELKWALLRELQTELQKSRAGGDYLPSSKASFTEDFKNASSQVKEAYHYISGKQERNLVDEIGDLVYGNGDSGFVPRTVIVSSTCFSLLDDIQTKGRSVVLRV